MTRQSIGTAVLPPRRSSSRSCSTRSSLACRFSGMLSISSRNSVPPGVLELADAALARAGEGAGLVAEHLDSNRCRAGRRS
jgi:hypothetical protein